MSTKKFIISIFAITVLGAGAFALTRDEKPTQASLSNSQSSTDVVTAETPGPQNTESGTYTDYSDEAFAKVSTTKVLFFHAPWCGQCRSIEAGIVPGSIPDNVTIFKVDYDSRQDIRKKYGVTMRTSFVVLDDQGNVKKKYVAYDDPYFDSVKKQIFNN